MFVRSASLVAGSLLLSGCFLFGAEPVEQTVVARECSLGEVEGADGACHPCGVDQVSLEGACVACPADQHPIGNVCEACDNSCRWIDCNQVNACGRTCVEACAVEGAWTRLLADSVAPEATDSTCADVALELPDGAPGWREGACVGWDPGSESFLVFGGERVTPWAEPKCPPVGRCDNRRSCTLQDSWLVKVDAAGEAATWSLEHPVESPTDRTEMTCVSTPDGVVMFGGMQSRRGEYDLGYNAILPEDLWVWRGGAWERSAQLLGIGAIRTAPAAWDPVAGELIVVGGCDPSDVQQRRICSGRPLEGPLTCVGEEEIEHGNFPWPYAPSIAWDEVDGARLLLVGGTIHAGADGRGVACAMGGNLPASGETWELTRGGVGEKAWKFRQVPTSPIAPGESAAMAGGPTGILRVGGINRDPTIDDEIDSACLFDGGDWSCAVLTENGGPQGRDQTSLASGGGRSLLVGGSGNLGFSLRDLWLYDSRRSR